LGWLSRSRSGSRLSRDGSELSGLAPSGVVASPSGSLGLAWPLGGGPLVLFAAEVEDSGGCRKSESDIEFGLLLLWRSSH
jgi:hypothetical protein